MNTTTAEAQKKLLDGVAVELEDGEDTEKGIPQFWLNCLHNNSLVGSMITEDDLYALEKLTDITVEYDENYTSFVLSFHFDENEFFTNRVLTKKYSVTPDLLDERAPTLDLNEGTEVSWIDARL